MHIEELFVILEDFMDLLLKLLFFISYGYAFSYVESSQSNSTSSTLKCHHGSIDLHYPFTSSIHDSPEFNLLCKNNHPAIKFPSYGELGIKSISYPLKKIDLIDPRNCVHGVFLNLDLSYSHFNYYYVVKNYTYLNCSSRLPPPLERIPCLSGDHHHVYTVGNITTVALDDISCRILKTVAIPFCYSPYLADNSFGLGLTWNLPELHEHAQMVLRSESSHLIVTCLGLMSLAISATMVTSIIIHSSRKQKSLSEEDASEEIRKLHKASDMLE